MKGFFHIGVRVVLAVAAACLLLGCKEKGEKEEGFLVNFVATNSTYAILPEGGSFQLFVESDAEWEYILKGSASWFTVTDQKVNSSSWMLTLVADEYAGESSRSAVIVFTSGSRVREVTVEQTPEDPQLQVRAPGVYGVAEVDYLYERTYSQISRITSGDKLCFSILYPSLVRAVTVTVPSALEEGAVVPLNVKVVEKDRTLVMKDYPEATVLRIREPYVWLKVDDTVFFVIEK